MAFLSRPWALLLAFFLSSPVAAQDLPSPDAPVEAIPPGDDLITPLQKGEKAPHDGQLFAPLTALRWANWLQQYKYRLKWDTELVAGVCRSNMAFKDKVLQAEEERAVAVERDLRERLERSEKARLQAEEEARNPPWYSTWEFGLGMGVVSSAVLFGAAVAALTAAPNPR